MRILQLSNLFITSIFALVFIITFAIIPFIKGIKDNNKFFIAVGFTCVSFAIALVVTSIVINFSLQIIPENFVNYIGVINLAIVSVCVLIMTGRLSYILYTSRHVDRIVCIVLIGLSIVVEISNILSYTL